MIASKSQKVGNVSVVLIQEKKFKRIVSIYPFFLLSRFCEDKDYLLGFSKTLLSWAMIVVVKSFYVDMLRALLFLFLSGHTTVFTVLHEWPKFNPKWVEDGREMNYGSLMSVWFLSLSYSIDLQQRGRLIVPATKNNREGKQQQ